MIKDERAVSEVVGVLLLLTTAVIMLSFVQSTMVPAWNKALEYEHLKEVEAGFLTLSENVLSLTFDGEMSQVFVDLGVSYPTRPLLRNPGLGTHGTLNIEKSTVKLEGTAWISTIDASDSTIKKSGKWHRFKNGVRSNKVGAYLSYEFVGSSAYVTFWKDAKSGAAEILLDGVVVDQVSLYSSSPYEINYSLGSFEQGTHTLTIRVAKAEVAVLSIYPGPEKLKRSWESAYITFDGNYNYANAPQLAYEHGLVIAHYPSADLPLNTPPIGLKRVVVPALISQQSSLASGDEVGITTTLSSSGEYVFSEVTLELSTAYPDAWRRVPGVQLEGNTVLVKFSSPVVIKMLHVRASIGSDVHGSEERRAQKGAHRAGKKKGSSVHT